MRTRTSIQLRFNDVDMARHVHNAVYLSYFEQGRMDLLRSFIPKEHDWSRQGMILARNEVDYLIPLHLSDTVEVETWCSKLGTKSFDLSYALFAKRDGPRRIHAQGRSIMVCFDHEKQASIPIPDAWRKALARMMVGD